MEYRRLGRSDLNISSIGLGCVTFGREIDRDTSFAVLDRARERGITLLDTAACYGEGASERVIGAWLADRRARSDILLATKVTGTLTREHVLASANESLARLRTDFVDLLQLHNWDAETPMEETLRALHELVRQGKARWVGCSNLMAGQLRQTVDRQEALGLPRMQSIQPVYNLVHREIEAEILPLCAKRRIGAMTYSPLGAGFLTGKYRRGAALPPGARFDIKPGHQAGYFTDSGWRIMESLRALSESEGVSMIQLALSWILRRPGITSVLVGARSPEHVEQALQAERLDLPAGTRAQLDAL